MKLVLLVLSAALTHAGCLAVDTIVVNPDPICGLAKTCTVTGGVTDSAFLTRLPFPTFTFTAHNSCKIKAPIGTLAYQVDVAFYDADGFRTGVSSFLVGQLDVAEKVKHLFIVPDEARVLGKVVTVKVKAITETGGISRN